MQGAELARSSARAKTAPRRTPPVAFPTRLEIDVGRCRRFAYFAEQAWPHFDPAPFVRTWHIDLVCAHLEAVARAELKDLVVSQPPGTSKSKLSCVLFPAWVWTWDPSVKFLLASYTIALSTKHVRLLAQLLQSEWYRERWGSLFAESRPNRQDFDIRGGGGIMATMPGGAVTGRHADIKLVDDPIKPRDAQGAPRAPREAIRAVSQWWSGTFSTRNTDHNKARSVVVMQRLHFDDLAGELVRAKTHVELRLPMRYEADSPCVTPWGRDPRTVEGELLCPQRINEEAVQRLEAVLGPDDAAAQLQQRPSRKSGAIFRREWFRYYTELPGNTSSWIQVWDMTFRGRDGTDFVSGLIWCVARDRLSKVPRDAYYLVDRINERLDFPASCAAIRAWRAKYPQAEDIIIEDAANGPAIEQALRAEIPGIQLSKTQGGKEARAHAVSNLFKDARCYLPADAPWIAAYEEQLERFPKSAHDDDVDATSHGLLFLHRFNLGTFEEAMAAVRGEE